MKLPEFGKPLPAHEKRLILGEPTQQLFPLKYDWAWDTYQLAKKNHWEPEEVSLTQDRFDYAHKLTDEERWMFDWSLSMLTTQDLVVMGNLEEAIERHLTCPEISIYLARQTAEEGIHTESYQLIVESLSLDEDKVYQRFLHERSLYAKVEMAYRFHRRLLELRMDDHKSFAAIGEFIRCVAFWALVMEGAWFYYGFNWVYALRDRGLMPGAAEMLQFIQRDEGLHRRFWLDVINTLIKEYPEAYTSKIQTSIASTVKDAAHLEQTYAQDVCNGVLGISAKSYMDHYRHGSNQLLGSIGIEPAFGYKECAPMPWVAKYETLQERNFFEAKVSEYQKRSALGEIPSHNDDGHDPFASPLGSPLNGDTPDD